MFPLHNKSCACESERLAKSHNLFCITNDITRINVHRMCHSTIIKINDGGLLGDTWVKVSHKWSNVLSGCQHLMDHISCVDKTCGD